MASDLGHPTKTQAEPQPSKADPLA